MFDLINGLPVHALVVHAVVVLVPLAALGTIAIALRPAWRVTYGPLVVLTGVAAAVLCPVATSSGEALEKRVGDPGEHAELGDQLVWFVIPMVVLALALVLLERRRRAATGTTADDARANDRTTDGSTMTTTAARTSTRTGSPLVVTVVAALAVLASLATGFQAYRVGDSGAKAVWGDQTSSSSGSSGDDTGSDD